MTYKNKIFLIGNGFDIAHKFKTKFSDFADHYLDNVIIPTLIDCVRNNRQEHPLFNTSYLQTIAQNYNALFSDKPEDILRDFARRNEVIGMRNYIVSNYSVLNRLLKNSLLSKLYFGTEKSWFDIENKYFSELIPMKNKALKCPNNSNVPELKELNEEFQDIKVSVEEYLNTIEIETNEEIDKFLDRHLKDSISGYIINFNYTSTVKRYIANSDKYIVNHIHGSLKEKNIIFGYGNDQNSHYQEMKNLEIEDFLHFFKTFDYLDDINYDRIYDEALNKYDEYEVYIIGHSLGMTDKTLISEILNSEKCKKIYLFKRGDLKDDPKKVKSEFRLLNYAASRILTDEKELRRKVVNYKSSNFFPN
jgi:hypothetical protein